MSKAGKRLIESAQQALDFADGKADISKYRVHIPETDGNPTQKRLTASHRPDVETRPLSDS